jgi:hypothetical protein
VIGRARPRSEGRCIRRAGRERVPDLRLGAVFLVCHNRDARKKRATPWEVARLGDRHTLKGAAANDTIRRKDTKR